MPRDATGTPTVDTADARSDLRSVMARVAVRLRERGSSDPLLILLVGGVVAQLIPLVATPLLTRLYVPADFGSLALFVSLASLLAVVATGRYELAILNDPAEDDGLTLLLLACGLAAVIAFMALIGIAGACAIAPAAQTCTGAGAGQGFIWFVPLAGLSTAWLSAFVMWSNRKREYRRIATNRVLQSSVAAIAGIAFGVLVIGGTGLILATLIAQWLAVFLLGAQILRSLHHRQHEVSWAATVQLARRHAAFPLVNLPHAVLDNVQTAAVLGALTIAFGVATMGLYAFTQRIMRAPILLLGSSLGQVFQQRISEAHHQGLPLRPLVVAQLRSLARWAVPFIVLAPLAPWAFAFVFGEQWREAGVYGLILMPWMVANFIVSPLSQLPLLLGRQRGAFAFGLAYQAALLIPCLLAILVHLGADLTFALQSVASCVVLAAYGRWLVRISEVAQADD